MDDLQEERQKIAIEIMRTENVPIMTEYMIDVLHRPRDALEKKLDGCDGYLGIFHKRWGYVPKNNNPDELSVTALEYERAKNRNLPCLIFISNYEKDDELKKFVKKISDLEHGIWRTKYTNSHDLIQQVIRGIPTLVSGISSRQVSTSAPSIPLLEILPTISSPSEANQEALADISEEVVNSYVNFITSSSKEEVKDAAWRYLGKLAQNKRIWKCAKVWEILNQEILSTTPTVFFFSASSILKWMMRNSERDFGRHKNPTQGKIKERYLSKFENILGSTNIVWDSYHRVEVKQIVMDITEPEEMCKILWEAWKKCAQGIENTNEYTHLTQHISTDLEGSSAKCKDSIRIEQFNIIGNGQPHYFADRAKELHI